MDSLTAGSSDGDGAGAGVSRVLRIDEAKIRSHVDEVVRSTVEATLNQLLKQEADRVAGARRYERSEGRQDTRARSYERKLMDQGWGGGVEGSPGSRGRSPSSTGPTREALSKRSANQRRSRFRCRGKV